MIIFNQKIIIFFYNVYRKHLFSTYFPFLDDCIVFPFPFLLLLLLVAELKLLPFFFSLFVLVSLSLMTGSRVWSIEYWPDRLDQGFQLLAFSIPVP